MERPGKGVLRTLTAGLATTTAGMYCNLAALLANEGLFPEFAPGSYAGYLDAEHARLAWLGDWIPLGRFWLSPGDLLIFGGLAVVAVAWGMLVAHGMRTGAWNQPLYRRG